MSHRYADARRYCEQALALHRQLGDRDGEACTLDSLGYITSRDGKPGEAIDHYRTALDLFRELGNSYEEANTLANLGDALHDAGRAGEARRSWQEALDQYRAQHSTADVERLRTRLSTQDWPAYLVRWVFVGVALSGFRVGCQCSLEIGLDLGPLAAWSGRLRRQM